MELVSPAWFPLWGAIALLVVFGSVSFREPRWGIYVIAATLPSYLIRLALFGIPTTILELCILILFFVWIIRNSRWKHINFRFWQQNDVINPIPRILKLPLILLLVSAFLAALVSPNQTAAFGILKAYFIDPFLFLIVFVYEIKSIKHIEEVLKALGLLVIALGIYALIQFATGIGIPNPFWAARATRRTTTLFGYPNASSLLAAPIVALYFGWLGWLRSAFNWPAFLFKISVILMGVAIIVTAKTLGAVIALGVVAFFIIYSWGTKKYSWLRPVLLLAGVLLIAYAFIAAGPMFRNIEENRLSLTSSSFEIRANQWRETLALLYDKPIFGAGLAGYQQALKPYHRHQFLEIYLYPHDILLNFWVETGILGLIAIVWLLVLLARILKKTIKHSRSGAQGALARGVAYAWIVIVIHGLVDVPYFKNDLSVLWMLLVGITIVITNDSQQNSKSPSDTYRA